MSTNSTTSNSKDLQTIIQNAPHDNRYRTEDVTNTEGIEFSMFGLKKDLLMGIFNKGFTKPSPIQEKAIPVALMRKNILGRAKNGTGKTCSFVIPCLQLINTELPVIQAIILVPTRELALQTSAVVKEIGKFIPNLQCMVSTGGTSVKEDILRLEKPVHILVGTPGRINDLIHKNIVKLGRCDIIVMDEADKLLSSTFIPVIEDIIHGFPKAPQIVLFSATFPVSVKSFKDKYMPDAEEINIMEELTLRGVTQYYAYVEERDKVRCLTTLFSRLEIVQSIIFCNSVERVELLTKKMTEYGYACMYIHSQMKQEDRNRVFHEFRQGRTRHLVCSDLITRGIDVPAVNVVINFDFPYASETYLHRIGRSGRYGHLGLAINLITKKDKMSLYQIEQELGTEIKPIPREVDRTLYCS